MSKRRRSSRSSTPSASVAPSVPAAAPALPAQSSLPDPAARTFQVRKQTVVFGGHATWLKVIRPMLRGNIRFIERDLGFSLNLIRNADIVWIQTNSLSHAMYTRIAGSARQYHKPVRYFSYASAARCARQVLEADA